VNIRELPAKPGKSSIRCYNSSFLRREHGMESKRKGTSDFKNTGKI
jgi:hypothetical protein